VGRAAGVHGARSGLFAWGASSEMGVWLVALLAAVFPANLYMAREPQRFRKVPSWALYARLPLQPLMMVWAWRATRR